jgi:hypothetical protein
VIYCLGDVHGNCDHIEQALDAAKVKPAAVIFLGDIEAPIPLWECCAGIEKRGVDWYWVIGNHDTDSKENYANVSDEKSMAHNIDGKVVTVDGLRIAGLGGIFRGEVWHPDLHDGKPTHATYQDYEKHIRSNANLKRRLSPKDLAQMQAVPPESRHWNSAVLDQSRIGKLLKHRSTIYPDAYEKLADQKAELSFSRLQGNRLAGANDGRHRVPWASSRCLGLFTPLGSARIQGLRCRILWHHEL